MASSFILRRRVSSLSYRIISSPSSRRSISLFSRILQNSQQSGIGNLSDPFPLPLSSDKWAKEQPIPEDLMPSPIPRHNESLDSLRARLNYQSRKRGTLESDLLLSTFAKENLEIMTKEELQEFDKLMDEPDWDIYYWSIYKKDPPSRWVESPLLAKLRVHASNQGKVVRMMPELPDLERENKSHS